MWLTDQLAEQHILAAQKKGELENLPGSGEPLRLDDDSHVPAELRSAYRLLKNSGYLPPELALRREALQLSDLLSGLDPSEERYEQCSKQLLLMKMKLQQAGMSTDFLAGDYAAGLNKRFSGAE
ncbi:DUF1992 domain-containing protein [Pantoea sp. FN060301]|uniref:DnaJ family domain-containing protein n=1 Tax=Pantoea sp. FN060301 TaxID=3420380 RepID=UPI003D17E399